MLVYPTDSATVVSAPLPAMLYGRQVELESTAFIATLEYASGAAVAAM